MKTTIDNNQRVFMLAEGGNKILCNLSDIENCLKEFEGAQNYVKVFHIWNNDLKRMSKKALREMLQAHEMNFDFVDFLSN